MRPLGVGEDGLTLHLGKRDRPRRVHRWRGQHRDRLDEVGIQQRPLEGLHAAHRATDDEPESTDAERLEQRALHVDHVADGHGGRFRLRPEDGVPLGAARPGGAVAASERVAADDEVPGGVERTLGPNQRAPPVGHVRRTGQRVADEHRVVARRGELTPRLVRDGHARQHRAGLHGEGRVQHVLQAPGDHGNAHFRPPMPPRPARRPGRSPP